MTDRRSKTKQAKTAAKLTGKGDQAQDPQINNTHTKKPAKELAAEWVEITALKPWDRNPRHNDEPHVGRIVESMKRFGFTSPILARRADGEVIAGHTRLKAAEILGLKQVPVRFLDLDPADAHLLALADNRLNELGSWDHDQLTSLLGELREQGADTALVAGWSDTEIDLMIKATGESATASPPEEFKSFDESIETEHTCPKCGYEWS